MRPSKIGHTKLWGGALLDALAFDPDEKANYHEAYQALAEYADQVGLSGRALRTFNNALARLLAARAGVALAFDDPVFWRNVAQKEAPPKQGRLD